MLGIDSPGGWPQRRWNAALGAAVSETMWVLLADAPGGAVLVSCCPTDFQHFVEQGLRRAGVRQTLEIWCDVPVEIARRRFEARHPRRTADRRRMGTLATDLPPLKIGSTLRTDTTGPVDTDPIVAWVNQYPAATDDTTSARIHRP
ncbi:hypothetical protein ACFYSJ_30830 [Streptomyces sp. NPDC005248]|uniref:hypothetical protein n=1 Tax=Streptomyces sp. NPDC005248 TaxID=3364709 RepID=UPI0036848B5A